MDELVLCHPSFRAEAAIADVTFEFLLTGMRQFMLSPVKVLVEAMITVPTLVLFVPGVHTALVLLTIVDQTETLLTEVALVRFLARVGDFVTRLVTFIDECGVAIIALMRALSGMYSLVNRFVGEAFEAIRAVCAAVRSLDICIVRQSMPPPGIFAAEHLPAE